MISAILTLNAGSSSIKFALFAFEGTAVSSTPLLKGQFAGIDSTPTIEIFEESAQAEQQSVTGDSALDHDAALEILLNRIDKRLRGYDLVGVGHRVVHGGAQFSEPVLLTQKTIEDLEKLTPLAPGHQPHNLNGVEAAQKRWPSAKQVGCFDTAFHRTQPRAAEQFGLPRSMTDDGIIRYGFHGLSYEYIASVAPEIMEGAPHQRMIVAHLGAGVSMCAIRYGKSIATTMGFTALDGLPMGTRCGDLDPGILLYLIEQKGMAAAEITNCLYEKSGLLGISGISGDMRTLEASENPHAREAVDYFIYRAVREIGSLTAALGGLDALVFTAGIGENAASIREKIVNGSQWLEFELSDPANASNDKCVTSNTIGPSAWVIPTNEELMIAQHTAQLITQS